MGILRLRQRLHGIAVCAKPLVLLDQDPSLREIVDWLVLFGEMGHLADWTLGAINPSLKRVSRYNHCAGP